MKFSTILKTVTLGAGICIFTVGLVLAQTPPAPDAKTARQEARAACEAGLKGDLSGDARRDAMRKCMTEKRETFRQGRKAEQEKRRETMRTCRDEVKNQRLTEDERRNAIEECAGKKDPHFVKLATCRKEAQEKKLERGDQAFRSHMRACMTRG